MDRDGDPHNTVVIVGAGAAGLAAGYDCWRAKIPFVILEASDRFGGRILKNDTLDVDCGAEWMHVDPSVLEEIVDDDSIKLDHIKTEHYQIDDYRIWRRNRWQTIPWSNHYWNFCNYTWYDFFADYMAKHIENHIQYKRVVQSIDYSNESVVRVECQDGCVVEGSQVIVTVALPVLKLKKIVFEPPLPVAKQTAIDRIPFEPGLKAFFTFSKPFYHEGFEIHSAIHGETYFWNESGCKGATDQFVLGLFCYGDRTKELVKLTNTEILHHFLGQLDVLYNGLATQCFVDGIVYNWTKEPFIGGLYSSYRTGLRYMYELSKPVSNQVFFAGEALPVDGSGYGYAHGAALSGKRAVRDIVRVQQGKYRGILFPTNWTAYCVHVLSLCCCGLEHCLFFKDDD